MDDRALDRLLTALGEGMAARVPAPEAAAAAAPLAARKRRPLRRRARVAAFAAVPVLALAALVGEDVVWMLPFYGAMLLLLRVPGALHTALGWAVGWGTLALALQALVRGPQPGAVDFMSSAGPPSLLMGLGGLVTGGVLVGFLRTLHPGRELADVPALRAAAWGGGAGTLVAGAAVGGALALGLALEAWFAPTLIVALGTLGAGSAGGTVTLARLVEDERAGPRRLRAVLGTSMSWGLAYGLLGLLVGVPQWMVVGLISGAGFSAALGIAERRGVLRELTLRRVGGLGALGSVAAVSALMPLFLVMASGGDGLNVPAFLSLVGILGAGAGAGTLAMARLARLGVADPAAGGRDGEPERE